MGSCSHITQEESTTSRAGKVGQSEVLRRLSGEKQGSGWRPGRLQIEEGGTAGIGRAWRPGKGCRPRGSWKVPACSRCSPRLGEDQSAAALRQVLTQRSGQWHSLSPSKNTPLGPGALSRAAGSPDWLIRWGRWSGGVGAMGNKRPLPETRARAFAGAPIPTAAPPAGSLARPQPHLDGGPGRVRPGVPSECDLLPAHLRGRLREAGDDLHRALTAPPLPQPGPQPSAGGEGGAQEQAGGVRAARASVLPLGAGSSGSGEGRGGDRKGWCCPLPHLPSRAGFGGWGGGMSWSCSGLPEA